MNRASFLTQAANLGKQTEDVLYKYKLLHQTQGDNEIMRCVAMLLADAHNGLAQLHTIQQSPTIYIHKDAQEIERFIVTYIQNHLNGALFLANTTITNEPESNQHRCYADELVTLVRLAEQLNTTLDMDTSAMDRAFDALKDLKTAPNE